MNHSLVIIPTYNEIENIHAIIQRVFDQLVSFDLLIIVDGSADGTAQAVNELQDQWAGRLHLIERPGKLGLGTAYIAGFKWPLSRGSDYVYEMDADFSHTTNDLV